MARALAFVVAATAVAGAVYFGQRLLTTPVREPSPAVQGQSAVKVDAAKEARTVSPEGTAPQAIDTSAVQPSAAGRFRLHGTIAVSNPRGAAGSALISVDGKPDGLFRVGDAVADGWLLLSVRDRFVEIGKPGGVSTFKLEAEVPTATAQSPSAPMRAPEAALPSPQAASPPPADLPPGMVVQGAGPMPPGMIVAPADAAAPAMVARPADAGMPSMTIGPASSAIPGMVIHPAGQAPPSMFIEPATAASH